MTSPPPARTSTRPRPRRALPSLGFCAALGVLLVACQRPAEPVSAADGSAAETAPSGNVVSDSQAQVPTAEGSAATVPAADSAGAPSAVAVADDGSGVPPGGAAIEATAGAAAGTPSDGSAAPPGECLGVTPRHAEAGPTAGAPIEDPRTPGSRAPRWALLDVQPQSCGFGQHYGLRDFQGRVTMVVLLSASCGYCLSQAEKLEQLALELQAADLSVNIVIVNQMGTDIRQAALLERTSLPVFQDVETVGAWVQVQGHKDDFFVYGADGRLVSTLRSEPGSNLTNLSSRPGYVTVKNELLAALGLPKEEVPTPPPHGHTHL